jgi:hypothetical protein
VTFIDAQRDDVVEGSRLGVGAHLRGVAGSPSTYYAAKTGRPRLGRAATPN